MIMLIAGIASWFGDHLEKMVHHSTLIIPISLQRTAAITINELIAHVGRV